MRKFTLYLYENFDAEEAAGHPLNPRALEGGLLDRALSALAEGAQPQLTEAEEERLIACGILRREGGELCVDTPVFCREDAQTLAESGKAQAAAIADAVARMALPGEMRPEDVYHLLCGAVFDGSFFDYLAQRGAVSVSREHVSGLDYLAVIYEDCVELNDLSNGLLCSYNRCTDGELSLQSFGDADGQRKDFYRAFRMREAGRLCGEDASVLAELTRRDILSGARALMEGRECGAKALRALEHYGYARDGRTCVPVYGKDCRELLRTLEEKAERSVGEAFVKALEEMSKTSVLVCAKQGVDAREIANELYHILFGMVNEELVRRGIAAEPTHFAGQGRYLKCIFVE